MEIRLVHGPKAATVNLSQQLASEQARSRVSSLLFCTRDGMTTKTIHKDSFTPTRRRACRASVPTGLRARGLSACGAARDWRQHRGWRITSVATANWLRPSGTATRHACGGTGRASGNREVRNGLDVRLAGRKALGKRMVASESPFKFSRTQRAITPRVSAHFNHCHLTKEEGHK